MFMATTATSNGSAGTPVEQLRSLTDTDVTVTTHEGSLTGRVLSCTKLSVWIISDDEDFVIALDEIVRVVEHHTAAAA